ncbi:unnamed protein product, partial [Pylaiella littoralis]
HLLASHIDPSRQDLTANAPLPCLSNNGKYPPCPLGNKTFPDYSFQSPGCISKPPEIIHFRRIDIGLVVVIVRRVIFVAYDVCDGPRQHRGVRIHICTRKVGNTNSH